MNRFRVLALFGLLSFWTFSCSVFTPEALGHGKEQAIDPVRLQRFLNNYREIFRRLWDGLEKPQPRPFVHIQDPNDPDTTLRIPFNENAFSELFYRTLQLQEDYCQSSEDCDLADLREEKKGHQKRLEKFLATAKKFGVRTGQFLVEGIPRTRRMIGEFPEFAFYQGREMVGISLEKSKALGIPILMIALLECLDHNFFLLGPIAAYEKSAAIYATWPFAVAFWKMYGNHSAGHETRRKRTSKAFRLIKFQMRFWRSLRKVFLKSKTGWIKIEKKSFKKNISENTGDIVLPIAKSPFWTQALVSSTHTAEFEHLPGLDFRQTIEAVAGGDPSVSREYAYFIVKGLETTLELIRIQGIATLHHAYWRRTFFYRMVGHAQRLIRRYENNLYAVALASPTSDRQSAVAPLLHSFEMLMEHLFFLMDWSQSKTSLWESYRQFRSKRMIVNKQIKDQRRGHSCQSVLIR